VPCRTTKEARAEEKFLIITEKDNKRGEVSKVVNIVEKKGVVLGLNLPTKEPSYNLHHS